MRTAVLGGGSWGSAFALYLGRREISTRLWIREKDVYEKAVRTRKNATFLPGFTFPPNVQFDHEIPAAAGAGDVLFVAVPSQFCRAVYQKIAPVLRSGQIVVSMTKGIEKKTLKRMSQLMEETFCSIPGLSLAVLSGPSFAREVAASHPTAVVIASKDLAAARKIQRLISSQIIRAYTSSDVVGVEIAGAMKNVIAIAAGILDGLEFGLNSRAALITRGLAEMTQLGLSLGAKKRTFSGLAGVGDLVLTCTGGLSRNHHVGVELGKGKPLKNVLSGTKMIAEGVQTTLTARQLARTQDVEMPISEQVYKVLYKNKPPRAALADLMARSLRSE